MEMYIPCNVGSQRRRQIQSYTYILIDALPVLHCAFASLCASLLDRAPCLTSACGVAPGADGVSDNTPHECHDDNPHRRAGT
jgi:hypothetical protein